MSEPLHHGFCVSDREPTGDCHYAYDPCCRYPKQELLHVHRFAFFVSGERLTPGRPVSRRFVTQPPTLMLQGITRSVPPISSVTLHALRAATSSLRIP